MELICGNSYSLEKAEQVINGGWALDPVHLTKHIYAKTALNLMEKVANKQDCPVAAQPNRKRTWSASNRSEHDGGGGAGHGGYSGGVASGSGKQHKMTDRSRKWPEVRRNDGPISYSDGRYGGGSGYGGAEAAAAAKAVAAATAEAIVGPAAAGRTTATATTGATVPAVTDPVWTAVTTATTGATAEGAAGGDGRPEGRPTLPDAGMKSQDFTRNRMSILVYIRFPFFNENKFSFFYAVLYLELRLRIRWKVGIKYPKLFLWQK
jgi:hypothetical protein